MPECTNSLESHDNNPHPGFAALLTSILRVFFYLLYHQFAWMYDTVAAIVSVGLWNRWVASVLPYLSMDPILELGYGPGHLQGMLLEQGRSSFAIDASFQMNRLAQRKLRSKGVQPRLVNGYAQTIPFPKRCFSHVVATFPTEYIFQPDTLSEIKRVLAINGSLIVLPVAVFTGSSLPAKAARLLHQVTGQAPARLESNAIEKIVQPIKDAGYVVDLHPTQVGDSQTLVIAAHPILE